MCSLTSRQTRVLHSFSLLHSSSIVMEACRQVYKQMALVFGSNDFSNWSRGVTGGVVQQMKCNWQRSGRGAV